MAEANDKKKAPARKKDSATALVSLSREDKERFTTLAKANGLSLSAFFRLAANEYINYHDWEH